MRRAVVRYYAALRLSIGIVVSVPAERLEAPPVPALVRQRNLREPTAVLADCSPHRKQWVRWRRYEPGHEGSADLISWN